HVIMILSFSAAIAVYIWHRNQLPPEKEGSVLVQAQDLPPLNNATKFEFIDPPIQKYDWKKSDLKMLWNVTSPVEFLGNPVVIGNMLVVGTFSNALEARSLMDGQLIWSVQKNQPVFTSPAADKEKIYIGEGLHTADMSGLTAISIRNGNPVWERKFGSHIESYPALDPENERLWIGAGSLGLWALNTEDGTKIWWAKIGHIDVPPLFDGTRLFAAAKLQEAKDGSSIFEIDPDSGKTIWSQNMNGNPMGKVMDLGQGKILVSTAIGQVGLNKQTDAGWVYGIDATQKGKVIWTIKLSTMGLPDGQLSQDKKTAFFALKNGEIWAINTKDGSILWIKKCGDEFLTDVGLYQDSIENPKVIGITKDGIVHILDALTGQETQKIVKNRGGYSAPLYHNGILYLFTPYSVSAYSVGDVYDDDRS
ncbi:MAG: PQQ-binding-like beta-propeller repeat protein, partial [Alphaproteobacteria bacterium]|nr:PQQ-binding-like beta-propeller repeat protein [Alphaproteobacteria bacterium]